MTCQRIRLDIHEALDDGTMAALPAHVSGHLAACDECREFRDELESLSRALKALPRAPLPADALDAVWRETVRARPGVFGGSSRFWRLVAAASFVTVLSTATLFLVFTPSPAPPDKPSPVELARASTQAKLVFGYTARALAATRAVTADRVLASKVSPAVRNANPHPSRRPS